MITITETGTVAERLTTLIDHFAKGNKTAFGRVAGIQSGVIAGFLGGRSNKPSFEAVQKILAAYPTVSPDWLLFGNGGMLRGQRAVSAAISLPPAAHPGAGIRTRLIYTGLLPEQGGAQQQFFTLEAIRYLPYRVKKKHQVLEEAEGGQIHAEDVMLDTERGEHVVYLATQRVDNEQRLKELRTALVAKGWVEQGMLDTPEQFKLLATGEPNPAYDPRFDGHLPVG